MEREILPSWPQHKHFSAYVVLGLNTVGHPKKQHLPIVQNVHSQRKLNAESVARLEHVKVKHKGNELTSLSYYY